MFKSGPNGFLTAFYAALALCDVDPDGGACAVRDVSWVVQQVACAKRQRGYVNPYSYCTIVLNFSPQ